MTGNQLDYWAEKEKERANLANEEINRQKVANEALRNQIAQDAQALAERQQQWKEDVWAYENPTAGFLYGYLGNDSDANTTYTQDPVTGTWVGSVSQPGFGGVTLLPAKSGKNIYRSKPITIGNAASVVGDAISTIVEEGVENFSHNVSNLMPANIWQNLITQGTIDNDAGSIMEQLGLEETFIPGQYIRNPKFSVSKSSALRELPIFAD